jgi:hypothetical protein
MSNYPINIPLFDFTFPEKNVNKEDMDTFGDFKGATNIDEYNEIMKKLDYIISEINMIKMEVREIKQNTYTTFSPIIPPPPKPIMYPVTPAYPGQPMPPYPYQIPNPNQTPNSNGTQKWDPVKGRFM